MSIRRRRIRGFCERRKCEHQPSHQEGDSANRRDHSPFRHARQRQSVKAPREESDSYRKRPRCDIRRARRPLNRQHSGGDDRQSVVHLVLGPGFEIVQELRGLRHGLSSDNTSSFSVFLDKDRIEAVCRKRTHRDGQSAKDGTE